MGHDLLKEGGKHKVKKTGQNEYTMSITLPKDARGYLARACPDEQCSPGYFKVKPGTGVIAEQDIAYCPYCLNESEPDDFTTEEQLRYAQDLAMNEMHDGIEQLFKSALGLGASNKKKLGGDFLSIEMSYKPGTKPHVRRPFEEDVRRDVVCPHCQLEHSVFGLAIWCPDCGQDIFLTHVEAEFNVIRTMLADCDRRQEIVGQRGLARDLENYLEDIVSIFEAVLKIKTRRYLVKQAMSEGDIERFFKKNGNAFQNISRAEAILQDQFGCELLQVLSESEIDGLIGTFEKRHPITHNLGVIDRKHLERVRSAEQEGKEVRVSKGELEQAIVLSMSIFQDLHHQLFSQ